MKEKLILFDWGNIVESHITGYTCFDAWNELFKACGYLGNESAFNIINEYNLQCISTFENLKNAYDNIARKYNFKTSYLEFTELYKKIFDKIDYYENVAQYEKSLNDRCYIGIFSNLTLLDKDRLNKQVDLSQYDYVFLSFEMGCQKPEKEIFEKVNEKLPFCNKNILFIDDSQDNIDIANKIGWNTQKATGLELEKIKLCCENFIGGIKCPNGV